MKGRNRGGWSDERFQPVDAYHTPPRRHPNRRSVLRAVGYWGTIGLAGAGLAGFIHENEEKIQEIFERVRHMFEKQGDTRQVSTLETELSDSRINALNHSPHLQNLIQIETEAFDIRFTAHSEDNAHDITLRQLILDRSERASTHGVSCARYFRDGVLVELPQDLHLKEGYRHLVTELAFFVPGIPGAESAYDNTAENDGAFSRLQVRPGTLKQFHDRDGHQRYTHDAILNSVPVQAQFLRDMMIDAMRAMTAESLSHSVSRIAERYFPGNSQEKRKEMQLRFLIPSILCSYQAGPGSMHAFIKWAGGSRLRDGLHSYDVFQKLLETAAQKPLEERRRLGFEHITMEQTVPYLKRVMAYAYLFDEDFKRRR